MRDQKRVFGLVLLSSLILLLPSCLRTEYDLEMSAEDEKLKRRVTVDSRLGNEDSKFSTSEEEALKLARAYGRELPKEGLKPTTFENDFIGKTPGGIGGAGRFLHWESNFGTASGYVERFRGSDDFFGQLKLRQESVDEFFDQLVAWIKTKGIRSDAQVFVDTDLRRDFQNISVYFWQASATSKPGADEALSRLGLYLVERGWCEHDEVAKYLFLDEAGFKELPELIFKTVVKYVARESGTTSEALVKQVPELSNGKKMFQAFGKFIESTQQFAAFEKECDLDKSEVNGKSYLESLFFPNFPAIFLLTSDSLDIVFKAPVKPVFTNGDWQDDKNEITWSRSIGMSPAFPTTACYAYWSEPNEVAQVKQFGKVVFDEFDLISYCGWYIQLDQENKRQWSDLLASIKPGPKFNDRKVEASRKVSQMPSGEPLVYGMRLLNTALSKKEQKD